MERPPPTADKDLTRNTTEKKKYDCSQCRRTYASQRNLRRHTTQVHTTVKNQFECSTCQNTFTTKESLRRHTTDVHTTNKFECSMCQNTFTTKASLRRHTTDVHTTNKFECSMCPNTFTRQESLRRHTTDVHTTDKKNSSSKTLHADAKKELAALPSQPGLADAKTTRACSVCFKPGHNKKTCPHTWFGSDTELDQKDPRGYSATRQDYGPVARKKLKMDGKACSCEVNNDRNLNTMQGREGMTKGLTNPGANIFALGAGAPMLNGLNMRLTSAVPQRVPVDENGTSAYRVHAPGMCSPVEVRQMVWNRRKGLGYQELARVTPFEAKQLLRQHAAGMDDPRVNGLAVQFWRGEFELFLCIHPCTNWVVGNMALFLAFLLWSNEQCVQRNITTMNFDPEAWFKFQVHLGTEKGLLHMQQAHAVALSGANKIRGTLTVTHSKGFFNMDNEKRHAIWVHCAAELMLGFDATKLSFKFMGNCFEKLMGIELPHQKPGELSAAPPGAPKLSKLDFALLFVKLLGEGPHWHLHKKKANRSVLAIAGLTNAGNVVEINGKLAFKKGHDACSDEKAMLHVANVEYGTKSGWNGFKNKLASVKDITPQTPGVNASNRFTPGWLSAKKILWQEQLVEKRRRKMTIPAKDITPQTPGVKDALTPPPPPPSLNL